MELMDHNIITNAALFPHAVPLSLSLDWDEPLPPEVHQMQERGGLDVIMCVRYTMFTFHACEELIYRSP